MDETQQINLCIDEMAKLKENGSIRKTKNFK